MENVQEPKDMAPPLYVGYHDGKRLTPANPQAVHRARESNYDLLTTPITSASFHTRILALLSSHLSSLGPLSFDASRTMETTQNTKVLTIPSLSVEDTTLMPNESISQLIGVTNSWIDLCSPDPLIADVSRQILRLEVAYAAFCGFSYVAIPAPRLHHGSLHSAGLVYYAKTIRDALEISPYVQIYIWLGMVDNPDLESSEISDFAQFARVEYLGSLDEQSPETDLFGTWDAWNVIRTICKYHSRLFVALSLPKHLPPIPVQSRWYSEPVHLLAIPGSSFIKNQKGYPVLSKAHQALIMKFMRLRIPPWILLCDVGPIPGLDTTDGVKNGMGGNTFILNNANYPTLEQAATQREKHCDPTPHLSYMRHLQRRLPPRSPMERYHAAYQDYLQTPLQPLVVDLESSNYEVFEKDPIKYEWYRRAIVVALNDWKEQKKPTSSADGRVIVAIVGAGRGPLIAQALRASEETGVEIEAWAVEKNPNAFIFLQRQNSMAWGGKVNLVKSDMRSWNGPQIPMPTLNKPAVRQATELDSSNNFNNSNMSSRNNINTRTVDILVSELLGSFGDNELSPECLDGVTHLLNPVYGISIPASYSTHLTPISAPKLHADISAQRPSNATAAEKPYVVMFHAIDYLSTSDGEVSSGFPLSPTLPTLEAPSPIVKTAWSFSHPNPHIPTVIPSRSAISNAHNVRQARLTFPCRNRGICHGLGGYFETVLYGDVELSTNPVTMNTKSPEMISWFPIYFPLKTPLSIPDDAEIVVTMCRLTDDSKIWYEWVVEVFKLERTGTTATGSNSPTITGSRMASPGPDNGNGKGKEQQEKPGSSRPPRRTRVGMSETHSSFKDGCLM